MAPATDSDSGGADAPVDRHALGAFLKSAPPELSDWAHAELARLAVVADSPVDELEESLEDDEHEDFYNDMEGDDDILHRRRRAARSSRGDEGDSAPKGLPPRLKGVLVFALIVGIAGGIWYAGRSGPDPEPTTPGISSSQAGETDTAERISELEAAVGLDSQDVDSRLELGVQYFNMGLIEQARAQWDAVLEIDEENVTAWYNLGFYYLTTSPADTAAARGAWERVIELEPTSEMAATVAMHLQGLDMTDESEE